MIMRNVEQSIETLTQLRSVGMQVAVDDFGVGYSSLANLKRFPIDTLKVDRSFIRDLEGNVEDRAITEAIIAMGRSLKLTVVDEVAVQPPTPVMVTV